MQTSCLKPKQANKHATHNTNTMITPPPTECTAPAPSLKQDANINAAFAITKPYKHEKQPPPIVYEVSCVTNPIYIPRKHTVQTYRSQQRKAKRK